MDLGMNPSTTRAAGGGNGIESPPRSSTTIDGPMLGAARPTWYAGRDSWVGEAWTMLHPPYTAMVLSFAIVGAVVSIRFSWVVLLGTLAAYFAGLGVGAHFLDQLPGMGSRYVRHWPSWALWSVGLSGVGAGVVIGIIGAFILHQPPLLLFVLVQGLCAVGYPLAPIFKGVLHRDSVFAVSWGSLPFLTSYYAQSGQLSILSLILSAIFATIAVAEIRLSRRSRQLRRSVGRSVPNKSLAGPESPALRRVEIALEVLSIGTTLIALGLLAGRALLTW
jgi:hypothetical protein